MKNISILSGIKILFLSFLLILNSCDDDYIASPDSENFDCEYCFEEKPEFVELALEFNMLQGYETVEYIVFSGFAFDSEVYLSGTADTNTLWIWVKPDTKYSIVAIYNKQNKDYFVVNDANVKTKYYKYACDSPCHYVYEIHCDLKLD